MEIEKENEKTRKCEELKLKGNKAIKEN